MTHKTAFTLFCCLSIAVVTLGGSKTPMDTPLISCAGGTQVSRSITICAPVSGTGLPAGFSLQWMTCDAYAANAHQWLSSEDPRLGKASFSGNANGSRYKLAAGQCVTVNVGDFLFDAGASTDSSANLTCGTCYVFRAFAHATSALNRSEFTPDLSCSTLDCGGAGQCTLPFDQWKALIPLCDFGEDDIRVLAITPLTTPLTLGAVTYSPSQVGCIVAATANGNGLIDLAHQLVAAKLNAAKNGSLPPSIAACVADADALIGGLVIPLVGTGFLDPSATSTLTSCLASYNDGAVGPGSCLPTDPGPDGVYRRTVK